MPFGPLEYVVIEFEGNRFTGEIMPELRALRDRGVLRVVDLLFVQKDQNGVVTARELSDLTPEEEAPYESLEGDLTDLFAAEDVEAIGRDLPNNSTAAIALFEHTWAARLRQTILNANGRVLSAGMVQPDEAEDAAILGAQIAADQASAPM